MAENTATNNVDPSEVGMQAHQFLANNVYVPTFFQKLAELGYSPSNREDSELCLQMAGYAAHMRDQAAYEQLNRKSDGLRKAAAKLGLVSDPGVANDPIVEQNDWIKAAATQFAMHPEVQSAVLNYQAALMAPNAQES